MPLSDDVMDEIEILKDFGHFINPNMIEAWPDLMTGTYVDPVTYRSDDLTEREQ
jgi:hypothetical protein